VVTVRFTFSEAENQRAMVYVASRSRAAMLMLVLGVALLAVGIASGKLAILLVGAAELAYWVVLVAVLPRLGSGRMAQSGSEQTLSFSEDGVTAANSSGQGSFEWRHWNRWGSAGELYVLRGAKRACTFVPRRAFATEAAESEFRDLLARHVGGR
jgi:hypothetical protein